MARSSFNVLIVDDDAAVRQVLCGLLSQAGMSVAEAASAREAEVQLEKQHFDVVVSDVRMPRGIRKHLETVELRPAAVLSDFERPVLGPAGLPLAIEVLRMVVGHVSSLDMNPLRILFRGIDHGLQPLLERRQVVPAFGHEHHPPAA